MRRRSRAGSKLAKAGSRKAQVPKRRNATTVRAESESARLRRERDEALEREKATAEVLRVISSSPGELEPVFNAMLENATRICEAKFGSLYLYDEDGLTLAAAHNAPPAFANARRRGPIQPAPDTALGRVIRTMRTAQVADVAATRAYAEGNQAAVDAVKLAGMRTVVAVPMLKDNRLIGVIASYRQEVRPFTEKQIALLQNFAAQAVIAIENARLLNELRQRTTDLSESLEQQTATSEILASMSGSITETKPVFDAILRNLLRLFGTSYAVVQLLQDGMIHLVAFDGEPGFERLASYYPLPLDDSTITGHAMLAKQVFQVAPLIGNPATPAASARFAREHAYNSMLSAPMIREGEVIGAIATARRDPTAFDDKQVALIKSFADQA